MIIDELNLTEKDWYKNKAEKRRKEAIDYFEKKQELIMETLKQEINEKMEEFKKQEKEFQAQSKELWDLQNIYSQLDNIRVDLQVSIFVPEGLIKNGLEENDYVKEVKACVLGISEWTNKPRGIIPVT